jgi:formate dehydrogenase
MGACDRAPVCAVGHSQVFGATSEKVSAAVKKGAHPHAFHTPNDFAAYQAKGAGYKRRTS